MTPEELDAKKLGFVNLMQDTNMKAKKSVVMMYAKIPPSSYTADETTVMEEFLASMEKVQAFHLMMHRKEGGMIS